MGGGSHAPRPRTPATHPGHASQPRIPATPALRSLPWIPRGRCRSRSWPCSQVRAQSAHEPGGRAGPVLRPRAVGKWWRNPDVHLESQRGLSARGGLSFHVYEKPRLCIHCLWKETTFCFRNVNRTVATTRIS